MKTAKLLNAVKKVLINRNAMFDVRTLIATQARMDCEYFGINAEKVVFGWHSYRTK